MATRKQSNSEKEHKTSGLLFKDLSVHPYLKEKLATYRKAMISMLIFSFFINILMLAIPLYLLQIYDRVLPNHSTDTLALLTGIVVTALVAMAALEAVRSTIITKLGTKKASQQLKKAQTELTLLKRKTIAETRNAYSKLKNSIQRVAALKRALISTHKAAKSTRKGFEAGTHTALDVYLANRDTYRAQKEYASARYTYLKQLTQLKKATGTLSHEDIQHINGYLS